MRKVVDFLISRKKVVKGSCFRSLNSLQAGSSVENGAPSTYKGLVTSQERKSLQRSVQPPK